MLIKTQNLNRRRVLRGMLNGGALAVSLPILDVFVNDSGTAFAATGAPLPERFGTWFWGLGIDPEPFTPKAVGADYEVPPQLKPIEHLKRYINVLTNHHVFTDGRPNLCHTTGWVALRAGLAPASRGDLPAPSFDTLIADVLGGGSRFRSINLAATGQARDSYSFQSSSAINPPEVSAAEFYTKVFGPDFQDPNSPDFTPDPAIMARKSVLSGVSEERKAFERGIGAADKARLDQYYTSIRELEERLALQLQKPPPAPSCIAPGAPGEDIPVGVDVELVSARHRAMTDILVMALACNQTKVFNMVYSNGGSNIIRKGIARNHHTLTHEEPVDHKLGYQPIASTFVAAAMTEWAYFIEKMATTPEGDGSLLDHLLVVAHSDCEIAKIHSITRIPMFTAGLLYGKVKAGQHIDGKGLPGSRLGFTAQRLMGVPVGSWGRGSMEVTQEISEIIA